MAKVTLDNLIAAYVMMNSKESKKNRVKEDPRYEGWQECQRNVVNAKCVGKPAYYTRKEY